MARNGGIGTIIRNPVREFPCIACFTTYSVCTNPDPRKWQTIKFLLTTSDSSITMRTTTEEW